MIATPGLLSLHKQFTKIAPKAVGRLGRLYQSAKTLDGQAFVLPLLLHAVVGKDHAVQLYKDAMVATDAIRRWKAEPRFKELAEAQIVAQLRQLNLAGDQGDPRTCIYLEVDVGQTLQGRGCGLVAEGGAAWEIRSPYELGSAVVLER